MRNCRRVSIIVFRFLVQGLLEKLVPEFSSRPNKSHLLSVKILAKLP